MHRRRSQQLDERWKAAHEELAQIAAANGGDNPDRDLTERERQLLAELDAIEGETARDQYGNRS